MSASSPTAAVPRTPAATLSMPAIPSRNVLIAGGVVLLHVGALWGLQSGLLRRVVETVVPVTLMSEMVTPPVPLVEPTPPAPPPPKPAPVEPKPVVRKPVLPPAPQPVARRDTAPAPNAPVGAVEPQPVAPPIAAPVAAAPAPAPAPAAPPAPPAPPKVELPSSSADYLQNPKPAYPPMSKRLGEQGKVVLRVLISADGRAEQAEIRESSGYDRLDQAARETVLKWRYVPGKRDGVPQTMWHNVPVHYVLE